MIFVPVIDLMGGRVVQARGGARERYRPLTSGLCPGSEPADVVGGFLGLYPFSTLYVADLDAIEGHGDNGAVIERLRVRFPALDLWVDSGLTGRAACLEWLARDCGTLVLGSESQDGPETLEGLHGSVGGGRLVLSLDFQGAGFLGPAGLLERPEIWPGRVIAMTLARVGGDRGPDLDRLRRLMKLAPGKRFFAAGGVRNPDDLRNLASLGVAGVLLASAFHDGRIGRSEITQIQQAAVP